LLVQQLKHKWDLHQEILYIEVKCKMFGV